MYYEYEFVLSDISVQHLNLYSFYIQLVGFINETLKCVVVSSLHGLHLYLW